MTLDLVVNNFFFFLASFYAFAKNQDSIFSFKNVIVLNYVNMLSLFLRDSSSTLSSCRKLASLIKCHTFHSVNQLAMHASQYVN